MIATLPQLNLRPDFFIVGAQKCGTTSLYHYLRQHPAIFMPDRKEPKFFLRDMSFPQHITDESEYLQLFADSGDATRRGEASALYLYSRTAAQAIHDFDPDARIIIMLRNPVDYMFSMHRQALYTGNENIRDFAKALKAEADRKVGRRIPRLAYCAKELFYHEMACFSTQVERYLKHFNPSQVQVILFDDLKHDPHSVVRETFAFLEVDDDIAIDLQPQNVTSQKNYENLQVRRWLKLNQPVEAVIDCLPAVVRRTGKKVLNTVLRDHIDPDDKLDPQFRHDLLGTFYDEIERLSHLIQRDLSHWHVS